MNKDKPYWQETLECYAFCLSIFVLFLGVIVVSGQLTGTDWIGLFKNLTNS